MTLILAVSYRNGIVIGADTLLTNSKEGFQKREVDKAKITDNVVYALCGDLEFLDAVDARINEKDLGILEEDVRENVKDLVHETGKGLYNMKKSVNDHTPYIDGHVLLSGISDNEAYGYVYTVSGSYERIRDTKIRGSGRDFARYIVEQRYNGSSETSRDQALEIVHNALKRTCEVHPEVGEPLNIFVADDEEDKVKPINSGKEEYLEQAYESEKAVIEMFGRISTPGTRELLEKVSEHGMKKVRSKLDELENS